MAWTIEFDKAARKQLARLDRPDQKRIRDYLFERVGQLDDPRKLGAALQGPEFGELWRYRVGDYRVICQLREERLLVLVVRIGHRREVYR